MSADPRPDALTIQYIFELRARIWETRDACVDHYPLYCPGACPNAGTHDEEIAEMGLCECGRCRDRSPR